MSVTPSASAPDGFLVHSFSGDDPIACKDYVRAKLGQPEFKPNGHAKPAKKTYFTYHDETGAVVYQVERTDYYDGRKKKFLQRQPDGNGGWLWNLGGVRPVPYRLPELLEALAHGRMIVIVEGEAKVDLLWSWNIPATCNSGGAEKWREEHSVYLSGADTVVLPDNDAPGRLHLDSVARSLKEAGASVRIVDLPGLGAKGDVVDWAAAGGTREQLDDLIENTALPWAQPNGHAKKPNEQKNPVPIVIGCAKTLQHRVFPPIKCAVKGYVVEGLTILAGRPKIGKSWLALDWNGAIARGGFCFGDIHCIEGAVLYLALEDNERRLKSRLNKLFGSSEWPENFEYATEWPTAKEGGIEAIREWVKSRPAARMVTVDVLERFRTRSKNGRENAYASDYETIKELQSLASELNIAILVVTHLRKGADDGDPIDKISGTLGLSGGADAFLILDSNSSGRTIYGRGRDLEEFDKAVRFNRQTCRWEILGETAEVKRSDDRSKILGVLKEAEEPLGPAAIATATGLKQGNVRRLLGKMVTAGEVLKAGFAKYAHPDNVHLVPIKNPRTNTRTPATPVTVDNCT